MKLGRASALGTFAVVHLAEQRPHVPVRGRDIADSLGVPQDYLLKILQQLVKARIVSSERGPSGGFQLDRDPRNITLLEIVEAIEGPVDGTLTVRGEIHGKRKAKVQIESACGEVAGFARKLLQRTTIHDLLD